MDVVKFDRNLYYEIRPEYVVDYSSNEEYFFNCESSCFTSSVSKNSRLNSVIDNYSVPLDLLKGNSSFGAIVVFLKNKGLSFKKIADLTNRDQRTIWCTYNSFKNKPFNKSFSNLDFSNLDNSKIFIPLDILYERQFSVLESIVFYLKEDYDLTLNEIAAYLGKNYRTIYTVYRRAIAKNES